MCIITNCDTNETSIQATLPLATLCIERMLVTAELVHMHDMASGEGAYYVTR